MHIMINVAKVFWSPQVWWSFDSAPVLNLYNTAQPNIGRDCMISVMK